MEQYPIANPSPHQYPAHISGSPAPPARGRGDGWRSALSTILILVSAPLIALLITSYVFQSYEVDGPSMETTLQNQDRLIVYKLPKSISKITKKPYIPDRGNIIVFAKRGINDEGTEQDKQLIKRVIGLPGDRVVVENGSVTIYNSEYPEGYNPDTSGEYPEITDMTPGRVDLRVDAGELFVMGDNRSNSLDSRNFGSITADEIVGKLTLRILPLGSAKGF